MVLSSMAVDELAHVLHTYLPIFALFHIPDTTTLVPYVSFSHFHHSVTRIVTALLVRSQRHTGGHVITNTDAASSVRS